MNAGEWPVEDRPTWDALFAAVLGYDGLEISGRQELNHGSWYKTADKTFVSLTAADPTRTDHVAMKLARGTEFVIEMAGSGPAFIRQARVALSAALS